MGYYVQVKEKMALQYITKPIGSLGWNFWQSRNQLKKVFCSKAILQSGTQLILLGRVLPKPAFFQYRRFGLVL